MSRPTGGYSSITLNYNRSPVAGGQGLALAWPQFVKYGVIECGCQFVKFAKFVVYFLANGHAKARPYMLATSMRFYRTP